MSVTGSQSSVNYVSDGATLAFAVPFPFQLPTDLQVAKVSPGAVVTPLNQGTDYAVAGAGAATGTVTLTAPVTLNWTVRISRVVPYTQLASLRSQGAYLPKTLEDALDRIVQQVQQLANGFSLSDQSTVLAAGSSAARTLAARFAEVKDVLDFGADPSGVAKSHAAINAALAQLPAGGGQVFLPPGTYLVDPNQLSLGNNQHFVGAGRNATIIRCVGAGDAVRIFNASNAGIRDLTINVDTNAAAVGLHIQQSSTGSAFRNVIRGVRFLSDGNPTVAGQIGIFIDRAGTINGPWFNSFSQIHIQGFARPIVLNAVANQNRFTDVGIEQFGPPAGTGYGVECTGDNNTFGAFTFSKGGSSSTLLYGFRFGPTTGGYNAVMGNASDIGTVGSPGIFEAGAGVINNIAFGTDSSSGSAWTYAGSADASNTCHPGPGATPALSVARIRPAIGNLILDAAGGTVLLPTAGLNLQAGALTVGTGRSITFLERLSTTWDPASLAAGAQVTATFALASATMGDMCVPSFSNDLQGMQLTAYVSSAGNITVLLRNGTGGAIDLASGTLKVMLLRMN